MSLKDFKNGYCLFTFHLEPFFDGQNTHMNLSKTGNLRLVVDFDTALTATTSCLIYSEFQRVFYHHKRKRHFSGMNTSQLLCVLNCDTFLKYIERNVLAADQLSKASLQHFPSAFIVNTDISSMEGKHWVAFYFDEYKNGEIFDSYGKSAQSYKQAFLNFLTQNAHK